MIEIPKTWNSLEDHPPLRQLNADESKEIYNFYFMANRLDSRIVSDLITIYAKAVGYEHQKQVTSCIGRVGLFPFTPDHTPIYDSTDKIDIKTINTSWRIGTPDWPHTKLKLDEDHVNGTAVINPRIDANMPHDDRDGLTERTISSVLYFADMAQGYLRSRELLIEEKNFCG